MLFSYSRLNPIFLNKILRAHWLLKRYFVVGCTSLENCSNPFVDELIETLILKWLCFEYLRVAFIHISNNVMNLKNASQFIH